MNTITANRFDSGSEVDDEEEIDDERYGELLFDGRTKYVRRAIWLYIVLWLIEGGLRRWVLPEFSNQLLLIRDPLVILIYLMAIYKKVFPVNLFIVCSVILSVICFVNAMVFGHGNLIVGIYGLRCDFLHVPLIFVMARVLRREDLLNMAKMGVYLAIPYGPLLVAQFYSPQSAWINRGVGGDVEGAGFSGAMGRFRPPGTFSFIIGPTQLYPLFTACWFVCFLARRVSFGVLLLSGASILVAIPISISRGLFLAVMIVVMVGIVALIVGGRFNAKIMVQIMLAAILLPFITMQIPAFKEGVETFAQRWENAEESSGGSFKTAIVERVFGDLVGSFGNALKANPAGLGTGFSSNVGQKLLSESIGFGASEADWGRLLYDNGFFLGSALILFRISLAMTATWYAFIAWRRRNTFGVIFLASAFLLLLNGQWMQTTSLGSSIIAGGLTLAACFNRGQDGIRQ